MLMFRLCATTDWILVVSCLQHEELGPVHRPDSALRMNVCVDQNTKGYDQVNKGPWFANQARVRSNIAFASGEAGPHVRYATNGGDVHISHSQ